MFRLSSARITLPEGTRGRSLRRRSPRHHERIERCRGAQAVTDRSRLLASTDGCTTRASNLAVIAPRSKVVSARAAPRRRQTWSMLRISPSST